MSKNQTACDVRDSNGLWLRQWSHNGISYKTHSYTTYNQMNQRCNDNSAFVKKHPAYIGCLNGFGSHQSFAEWCSKEFGYRALDEKSKVFHLDKDWIIEGNKVYSPETCMFIPRRINNFMTNCINKNIGVETIIRSEKFKATINDGGKRVYLGAFNTIEEASFAWKTAKLRILIQFREYAKMVGHFKLLNAMGKHIEKSSS